MKSHNKSKLRICFFSAAISAVILNQTSFAQTNDGAANGKPFQELQNQINDLNLRLDVLAGSGLVSIAVDCDAGESIMDALASFPEPRPVEITVTGLCNESVVIRRDSVTIQGESSTDGIISPPAPQGAITAIHGPNLILRNLTIHNLVGAWGVGCFQGSAVQLNNVTILGSENTTGVLAVDGGQCRIVESVIDGGGSGIIVRNALVDLEGTTVTNASNTGINLFSGGSLTIQNAGSVASRIANNGIGVRLAAGAHADLNGIIEDNQGDGVRLLGGSTARTSGNHPIRNNGGNGITVESLSVLLEFSTGGINDNDGWGVQCLDDSKVFGFVDASGNGAGDVDCP